MFKNVDQIPDMEKPVLHNLQTTFRKNFVKIKADRYE